MNLWKILLLIIWNSIFVLIHHFSITSPKVNECLQKFIIFEQLNKRLGPGIVVENHNFDLQTQERQPNFIDKGD